MIELSIERFITRRFSENNGEDLYEKGNPIWKDTCEYGILKSEYMSRGHYLYNKGHALPYATMSC